MTILDRDRVKDAETIKVRLDRYQKGRFDYEHVVEGGERGPLARKLILEALEARERARQENDPVSAVA